LRAFVEVEGLPLRERLTQACESVHHVSPMRSTASVWIPGARHGRHAVSVVGERLLLRNEFLNEVHDVMLSVLAEIHTQQDFFVCLCVADEKTLHDVQLSLRYTHLPVIHDR
jgi:hypothetical protein